MVRFDAIFKHTKLSGANHLIVEQEATQKKDMLESLAVSMNYLNSIPSPRVDSKSAYQFIDTPIQKYFFFERDIVGGRSGGYEFRALIA